MVDAQVVKVLSDNLVQIAIAGLSIDVLSEVPLIAGQTLQLSVSQTPDSIRLAIVGPGSGAAAGVSGDSVALSPNMIGEVAANPSPGAAPPKNVLNVLTPPEQAAVAVAAQIAATEQTSLAPLFANLDVAAASGNLPTIVQQAAVQVLAQQTILDQGLTGTDIKQAFQSSGLFLEASLAPGLGLAHIRRTRPQGGADSAAAGADDGRRRRGDATAAAGTTVTQTETPATPSQAPEYRCAPPGNAPAPPIATAETTVSPSLAPVAGTSKYSFRRGVYRPPALPLRRRMQGVLDAVASMAPGIEAPRFCRRRPCAGHRKLRQESSGAVRIVLPEALLNAAPRTMTAGAALESAAAGAAANAADRRQRIAGDGPNEDGRADDVTFHTNTPPPPFRGALPSAQPIAVPSIASDARSHRAHHLLADTDAAIARQTLLQVASLPDRADTPAARIDPAAPRWSFEIPFAMPQGTAMAQFEISRDGGGNEVEAAKRIWRARFSLDVEPAGPVHALVSLSGDQTSVRMWAERPATAAQLRAGAAQLSQALSKAELRPGDIVIRDGAPPQPAPARAGHFLDRAL